MNSMIFSGLLVFILLTHNVILVNEESLILVCFIVTISLIISKFDYLTDSMFQKYKMSQKESLLTNLTILKGELDKVVSQKQNKAFLTNLIKAKSYWTKLGRNLIYWIGSDLIYKTRLNFALCFSSFLYNENKITKLLNLALSKNLHKKILVSSFIETELASPTLKAQYQIVIRERLQFDKITTSLL